MYSNPVKAFLRYPRETAANETSFVCQTNSETPPFDGIEQLTWISGELYDLWRGGKLTPVAIKFMLVTTLSRTLSVFLTLDEAAHLLRVLMGGVHMSVVG